MKCLQNNPSVASRQLPLHKGGIGLCEFHNVKFQLFILTPCELAACVGGALHPASLSRYARGAICARSLTSKLAHSLRLIIIRAATSSFIISSARPCAPPAPSHVAFSSEREESRATHFGDYNERLIRLPSAATFSHRRRQTEVALFRI